MKATLRINGNHVITLSLKGGEEHSNKFAIRRWLQHLTITSGDVIIVELADPLSVKARLSLQPNWETGRIVYSASNDDGNYFAWSNLTPSYAQTCGFTAGILCRKKSLAKAVDDKQLALF